MLLHNLDLVLWLEYNPVWHFLYAVEKQVRTWVYMLKHNILLINLILCFKYYLRIGVSVLSSESFEELFNI